MSLKNFLSNFYFVITVSAIVSHPKISILECEHFQIIK
uniref:Uncharacterized protein n=1 Tax=Arundo donax TaxID=35708 RepID=A0A0A8ZZA0_ARUDO